ncbi:hypothetical protein F5Y08DRAFT_346271 [Xylaria arbuscula]|nr:hypothetical protein F5Y08DRAFT_346271 [Xylaria arbuscula]
MSSPFPSIQSFFSREVALEKADRSSSPPNPGDGFTASEIEAVVHPSSRPFRPSREYDACPIAELHTGMHNYLITARLVNFSPAAGHYFLVLSDGTAAMAVKMYYAGSSSEYQPLLGQRLSVWATAISAGNQAEIGHIPFCSVATTIYPGRNGATHIEFHLDEAGSEEDLSLRSPLDMDVRPDGHFPGLLTLKSYLSGGYEIGAAKVLVCVRSVGPRRTVASRKREAHYNLIEVGVYDDTASIVLKIWQEKIPSAKLWVPNQTVLLISQPTCSLADGTNCRAEIGLGYSSMVDVDPDYSEARWLRAKIRDMAKKGSIIIPYPAATWDLQLAMHGPSTTLFSLAEVEEQVRNQDPSTFTGKLSVVVLEMNLMDNWRKNTIYCTECCGITLYANKTTAMCKNCDTQRDLSLNPRLLGAFLDESGMITGNKLIWNDDAWTEFLFGAATELVSEGSGQDNGTAPSWKDLAGLSTTVLRNLEAHLLYSRVTLTFGWASELGRLCILGVEW